MDAVHLREVVTQFLAVEAMLLDEGRFEEWLDLLDESIVYEAPIRLGTNRRDEEFASGGYRFRDDKDILRLRVARLKTGAGYAETPPSRTVRSISSICILGETDGVVSVSSALILYRHRGNDMAGDTIHARRNDRLAISEAGLTLLSRSIIFAEVSLSTPNLGVFL